MRPAESIETQRLRLRPPSSLDADSIFDSYAQDEDVTRYLTWTKHETVADTRAHLLDCVDKWEKDLAFPWVIVRKEDNALIGMIELRINKHMAEFGYVLARSSWGRGYMSEALQAVIDTIYSDSSIYRIWAVCDVDNNASKRVLEKVGMQLEGELRRWMMHPNMSSEPRDCLCYSLCK